MEPDPTRLVSSEGFRADPACVWTLYAERKLGVRHAKPNAGNVALADYGRRRPGVLTVVTQNVDDLHQRRRLAADHPPARQYPGRALAAPLPARAGCDPAPAAPPACANCGNLLRSGRRVVRRDACPSRRSMPPNTRCARASRCWWSDPRVRCSPRPSWRTWRGAGTRSWRSSTRMRASLAGKLWMCAADTATTVSS